MCVRAYVRVCTSEPTKMYNELERLTFFLTRPFGFDFLTFIYSYSNMSFFRHKHLLLKIISKSPCLKRESFSYRKGQT